MRAIHNNAFFYCSGLIPVALELSFPESRRIVLNKNQSCYSSNMLIHTNTYTYSQAPNKRRVLINRGSECEKELKIITKRGKKQSRLLFSQVAIAAANFRDIS